MNDNGIDIKIDKTIFQSVEKFVFFTYLVCEQLFHFHQIAAGGGWCESWCRRGIDGRRTFDLPSRAPDF